MANLGDVADKLKRGIVEAKAAGSFEKVYRKYGIPTGGLCPVSK